MKWIETLVADATKKSARAAAGRKGKALDKYAALLRDLPKEWTVKDIMSLRGCTYQQANSMIQTMRENRLIYPARDLKVYARRNPDARDHFHDSKAAIAEQYAKRWQEWADELPGGRDITNKMCQDIWDITYDSAKYRITRLVELGLLEGAGWGIYRRVAP